MSKYFLENRHTCSPVPHYFHCLSFCQEARDGDKQLYTGEGIAATILLSEKGRQEAPDQYDSFTVALMKNYWLSISSTNERFANY